MQKYVALNSLHGNAKMLFRIASDIETHHDVVNERLTLQELLVDNTKGCMLLKKIEDRLLWDWRSDKERNWHEYYYARGEATIIEFENNKEAIVWFKLNY